MLKTGSYQIGGSCLFYYSMDYDGPRVTLDSPVVGSKNAR